MLLTAVLHNVGRGWSQKNQSPFISTTYGDKKIEVAKQFSKPQSDNEISLIFVYYMLRENKYSLRTAELNKLLKSMNVTWYPDIHNELIVADGILPHYHLGIL